MIKEDYLIRQIKSFARFLRKLFKMEREEDKFFSQEMGDLDSSLQELLDKGEINKAEDILFQNFSTVDEYVLVVARFYERLNTMTEEELEKEDFTREEIKDGLVEIMGKLNIPSQVFLDE